VNQLKAAKAFADAAKQRQAADVAALRQTVAALRMAQATTTAGADLPDQPTNGPAAAPPAEANRQAAAARRELKRLRARELVLLEEGDATARAKRTAEVDEMRQRLLAKELRRAEERAEADAEARAEIEALAVGGAGVHPPPRCYG
jgi:hypothetical protein